jgi:solute carrier family 25 citrate transporter 1
MAFVTRDDVSILRLYAKGTLTGAIETAIIYPTEYVKTQLQLQSKRTPQFRGIVDCTVRTVKTKGVRGLYTGAAPLVIGASQKSAARWIVYTSTSSYFRAPDESIDLGANMLCGFLAGVAEAVFAVIPTETVKTRVTDDLRQGTNRYTGSLMAARQILSAEGVSGIYRGVLPTILKQGTNQLIRFPLQLFFVDVLASGHPERRKHATYNGAAGALTGAVSVLLTMPQDTVKTRMQSEDAARRPQTTMQCVRQIYANDGILFFWAGTFPRLVRVSLNVGLAFAIYPLLNQII